MDAGVEGVDEAEALAGAAADEQGDPEPAESQPAPAPLLPLSARAPLSSKLTTGLLPGLALDEDDGPAATETVEPSVEEAAAPEDAVDSPPVRAAPGRAADRAPVPPQPALCLLGASRPGLRVLTHSISLDGLLDYNRSDRGAESFELNVFAETLADALAIEYAGEICAALRREHALRVSRRAAAKRGRAGDRGAEGAKRARLADGGALAGGEALPLEVVEDVSGPGAEDSEPAAKADEAPPQERKKVLLKPLVNAFRFFDRAGHGYLRCGGWGLVVLGNCFSLLAACVWSLQAGVRAPSIFNHILIPSFFSLTPARRS